MNKETLKATLTNEQINKLTALADEFFSEVSYLVGDEKTKIVIPGIQELRDNCLEICYEIDYGEWE